MKIHPQFAAAPENNESAGERHEKHEYGNEPERNGRRVASRRWRFFLAAAIVVSASTVTAVAARGRFSATGTPANIFDDDFDFCSCARHVDLSIFYFLFSIFCFLFFVFLFIR